jgi:hypothetical protein
MTSEDDRDAVEASGARPQDATANPPRAKETTVAQATRSEDLAKLNEMVLAATKVADQAKRERERRALGETLRLGLQSRRLRHFG